ncbi:MAG TPA: hypothetical protein VFJ85_01630 [Acidimicrobiales bacterium]|nr:hypothetical protein [Acidimicrobiales bacterium]
MGSWASSPLGPFADVMWADPAGRRVLLVPSDRVGGYVSAVYRFDEVVVVPLAVASCGPALDLEAGDVRLHLEAGPGWRIPLRRLRPPAVTRWVEGPIARLALGVRTYGVSPSGVREWYCADEYRRVAAARASVAGRGLGRLETRWAPGGFGFSEPPRAPAIVRVRPVLVDPSGGLDAVVGW